MHKKQAVKLWTLSMVVALGLTPALAQNDQRAVLSGTTGSLRWTAYGPGNIGGLNSDTRNLRISVHPQARVLGAKYEEENQMMVLSFRVNAPIRTVFDFHGQQLQAQGFEPSSPEVQNNFASANYSRNNLTLGLIIRQTAANTYRAELDLSEAAGSPNAMLGQGGAQNLPSQQGQTQQNQQTQPGQAQPNQPGQAQPNQPGQAQPGQAVGALFNYQIEGVQYEFYGPVALPTIQADARVVRLAVPTQAVDVSEPWQTRGSDVRILFEAPLTLQQGYDFYNNLMQRQGFQRTSLQTTNERYDAVYQRDARSIRLSINTAGGTSERRNFEVTLGPVSQTGTTQTQQNQQNQPGQAQPNQPGQAQPAQPGQAQPAQPGQTPNQNNTTLTAPAPLLGFDQNGLRYNFYGPDYHPSGLDTTPNQTQVAVMVPQGALDVRAPVQNADNVMVRFEHPRALREIFNLYNQTFIQQGFQQVGNNTIADNETRIYRIYSRGNNRIAMNIETKGGAPGRTNYEVSIDFTP